MRREEFEHAVRAAGAVLGVHEVLVIGSQALHGSVADGLPEEALRSVELDVAVLDDPEGRMADLLDGSIGEASMFHATFGYYAQGVVPETAVLPESWRDRLVRYESPATNGVVGPVPRAPRPLALQDGRGPTEGPGVREGRAGPGHRRGAGVEAAARRPGCRRRRTRAHRGEDRGVERGRLRPRVRPTSAGTPAPCHRVALPLSLRPPWPSRRRPRRAGSPAPGPPFPGTRT